MSGIRVTEFKKPKTIIVDQAKVESAYGPKSSILLESLAAAWSKSGFTIEVKGLSRDSLMNGLFVTIPIQVRWTNVLGENMLLNQYAEQQTYLAGGEDPVAIPAGQPGNGTAGDAFYGLGAPTYGFDNVCIRPNAFKCIRNATLSINGSSFSTRTDSYFTALSKLFCDGRVEAITGLDYERYPYMQGSLGAFDRQKGWYERCRALNTRGKVVHTATRAAANANGLVQHKLSDIVIQYDIKFPLWFGPFSHEGFPGLSGFDGQTTASFPYVSDLVLECTFTDDPLMDMFACSDNTIANSLTVANPATNPIAAGAANEDLAPDTYSMWQTAVAGDIKGMAAAKIGLLQPKLCYVFSEPDPDKMQLAPLYTLPSYRLITYEDRKPFAAPGFGSLADTVKISFPYIRLSNISALYICMAEYDRVDNGGDGAVNSFTGVGARSSRVAGGNYNCRRLGMACANRTCPIQWDTVKVSMSTASNVLSNFVNNTITPQRQYELFKKYSGNAMSLSYEAWKESSQMLLFSAEELCGIGAFSNSFQSLTLSVEFDVKRTCIDTKPVFGDWTRVANAPTTDAAANPVQSHLDTTKSRKGNNVGRAVVGRLICLEPELVSISEGAVSVEQVKLSQQELQSQLLGGAPEIEDANRLDTLAR